MEFKVKVYFSDYISIEDKWQKAEIKHLFVVNTWDDFNNLINTLMEASMKPLKFEVEIIREEQ